MIDYSRPVGWWCPVCGHHESETDVDVLWNLPDWLAGTDEHDDIAAASANARKKRGMK
jgi:hypothetical protein